tara:strand:+ start:5943 stop:6758 length:816 start_codon:yes stop_codon:yes gene_type:complete
VHKFSLYSSEKSFKNLYTSDEILGTNLEDSNQILVRLPNVEKRITDVIFSFDGQNLFDKNTSYFGTTFDLEDLLINFETTQDKNILVIATTSNKNRQIQYNPYPRNNSEASIQHLKDIYTVFIPSVLDSFNLNIAESKKHVLGASMGGLMAIKFSITYPEFNNVICLSPAFWYGFPGVNEDINNLNKNTFLHLYTGKKEGSIFGDEAENIFPEEWNLDFSSNNNFYLSGVDLIAKKLKENELDFEYFIEEAGTHNEIFWRKELYRYFSKNL